MGTGPRHCREFANFQMDDTARRTRRAVSGFALRKPPVSAALPVLAGAST